MVINDLKFSNLSQIHHILYGYHSEYQDKQITIVSTFGKFSSVEANVLKLETLLLNGHVLSEGHTSGHHIDAPNNHIKPSMSIPSM